MGETRQRKTPSKPSTSMAHWICWYTESRNVLEKRLTTTAFAFGFAMTRRTIAIEMNELFVDPRPPGSH